MSGVAADILRQRVEQARADLALRVDALAAVVDLLAEVERLERERPDLELNELTDVFDAAGDELARAALTAAATRAARVTL